MVCKLYLNEAILKIYLVFLKNSFTYDFNKLFWGEAGEEKIL